MTMAAPVLRACSAPLAVTVRVFRSGNVVGAGPTRGVGFDSVRRLLRDVPIVRLDIERIRALGWRCQRTAREAFRVLLAEMVEDARAGRL